MAHTGQVDGLEEDEPVEQPHGGSKRQEVKMMKGLDSHERNQRLAFISKRSGKSTTRLPREEGGVVCASGTPRG
eukprot:4357881-Prorocentrum_lima.AAC.1